MGAHERDTQSIQEGGKKLRVVVCGCAGCALNKLGHSLESYNTGAQSFQASSI